MPVAKYPYSAIILNETKYDVAISVYDARKAGWANDLQSPGREHVFYRNLTKMADPYSFKYNMGYYKSPFPLKMGFPEQLGSLTSKVGIVIQYINGGPSGFQTYTVNASHVVSFKGLDHNLEYLHDYDDYEDISERYRQCYDMEAQMRQLGAILNDVGTRSGLKAPQDNHPMGVFSFLDFTM